ncbi:MAG TPA: MFS transporter [Gemmataceae bacterium]|nr:MFS transporter [Gemmataceae bacterium]
MHSPDIPPAQPPLSSGPWWRELNSYHWFVLIVAALGWLFDTMDQQLFVLARTPALTALLADQLPDPEAETDPVRKAAVQQERTDKLGKYGNYATAIFIVGWATGGLIFGMFSDRLGRARTMMYTILIYSMFTGLSALSWDWWSFAFFRFITGMGVGGEFAAGVSLVAEVMPARARPHALGLLQALSAVGNMTAAGFSFLLPPQVEVREGIQGWRLLFLVGILPALLVILIFKKLREPESWQRAKEAIKKGERSDEAHRQLGDMKEMFRDPRWRFHTIIGVSLAVTGVLALWGVNFFTPELVRDNAKRAGLPKGDQDWYASMTSLLQNFGAFFGIYVFGWLTARVGRRWSFAVSMLLGWVATVMVFGFMTVPWQIWWMIPLLGFCSLMIFGGYAIYFPELYPTRLRSTGTGFCYNVARYLAAALIFAAAPLAGWFGGLGLTVLSDLGSVDSGFRYASISVASVFLLGLLILPFAPETKGKPLPE